ncbi:cAMP-dependent protein kinase [Tieghemostelium lacteum]|uniref:cAMP-dependent protein kinase n=1 Tax=Tieghemostelium lacteum TaxID=361077 RepID=A0A151ZFN8_TIELA|nr:cAMP-dependent protein kinase [Tieghemostelium lacteum]|eukprot:KYQ92792.1 cAMP-dependent protein kinase [Tieghemostelium lacteum]
MKKHITMNIHSSISNILQQQVIGQCFKPVSSRDQFEKLEFIGDSILNYEITKNIYQTRTMFDPHLMHTLRSFCTKNETLFCLYNMLNLEKFEEQKERKLYNDDKTFTKNKADIVEAMIGEMYLTQSERCKEILKDIISLLDYMGNEMFIKSIYHESVTNQAIVESNPNIPVQQQVPPVVQAPALRINDGMILKILFLGMFLHGPSDRIITMLIIISTIYFFFIRNPPPPQQNQQVVQQPEQPEQPEQQQPEQQQPEQQQQQQPEQQQQQPVQQQQLEQQPEQQQPEQQQLEQKQKQQKQKQQKQKQRKQKKNNKNNKNKNNNLLPIPKHYH